MSATLFPLLLAGAAGGFVRGVVGFLKYQFTYKNVKFEPTYILMIMALSSFVGLTVTWAVAFSGASFLDGMKINPAISFIVGYAGGDFLENIYKILAGKTTLFSSKLK